jgi:hypothetical protein
MLEESVREEVQKMLRAKGWNDYHPPDIAFKGAPVGGVSMGRPDIYLFNTVGPSSVCEVKTFTRVKVIETYLDPSRISNKQRRWLDWFTFGRKGVGLLAIGTLDTPRQLFLVPWAQYVIEEVAQANREAKELGEDLENFDIDKFGPPKKMPISIFQRVPWTCTKIKDGWDMDPTHPFLDIPTMPHAKEQWNAVSLRNPEDK